MSGDVAAKVPGIKRNRLNRAITLGMIVFLILPPYGRVERGDDLGD